MWDETNFLAKGFIDEVKGALTESGGGATSNLGSVANARFDSSFVVTSDGYLS